MFNPCSASVQGRRECPPPCAPCACCHGPPLSSCTGDSCPQHASSSRKRLLPQPNWQAISCIQTAGAAAGSVRSPPGRPHRPSNTPLHVSLPPPSAALTGQGPNPVHLCNHQHRQCSCPKHTMHTRLTLPPTRCSSTFGTHPQLAPFSLLLCTVDSLPTAVQSEAPTHEATALGLC